MFKKFSSFLLKFGGISIMVLLSFNAVHYFKILFVYLPTAYWIVGFLFTLFSLAHFTLLFTNGIPAKFANTIILMTTIKLICSLVFIIILSFFYPEYLVISAVQFSLLYLAFTLFDVFEVKRFLKDHESMN